MHVVGFGGLGEGKNLIGVCIFSWTWEIYWRFQQNQGIEQISETLGSEFTVGAMSDGVTCQFGIMICHFEVTHVMNVYGCLLP